MIGIPLPIIQEREDERIYTNLVSGSGNVTIDLPVERCSLDNPSEKVIKRIKMSRKFPKKLDGKELREMLKGFYGEKEYYKKRRMLHKDYRKEENRTKKN